MSQLSTTEIAALDQRIDAGIDSLAALKLPRPLVVIHLLRFYEAYLRLYAPRMANGNVEDYLAARKQGKMASTSRCCGL